MQNRLIFINILVFLCLFAQKSSAQDSLIEPINGLSLVSEWFELKATHLEPVVKVSPNYAAVIPFCFMPSLDSSAVIYDHEKQWVGERIQGTKTAIQLLKDRGIKVMVKPQIWVSLGEFTGKINMRSDAQWELFESNYGEYIVEFAKIAESSGAEMFCIGTEMELVVKHRPELFTKLITEVRKVYSGKLTYAENWDCFDDVPFWDQLDFIGVDAYFPISKSKRPSVKKLKKGWEKWTPLLDSLSQKWDRKIVFTEYGYRSIKGCAAKPWDYSKAKTNAIHQRSQQRALQVMFDEVWTKDYVIGGFLWKWHPIHLSAGGPTNDMFTVQNKLAEKTIRLQYSSDE